MIITAPDLFLMDGELLTSDGFGGFMKIHNYQGSLDGACSVYSLTMSLLYENIVAYEETETPSRKNGGRLLKELFSNYGLIKSGFHFSMQHIYIVDYQRLFILIGTTSVFTSTQNVGTNAMCCISQLCICVLYRLLSAILRNVRYQIQRVD